LLFYKKEALMAEKRNGKCECSECECEKNLELLLKDFSRFHGKIAKHKEIVANLESKEQAIIKHLAKNGDEKSLEKIKKEYPSFSNHIDTVLGKNYFPPSLGC